MAQRCKRVDNYRQLCYTVDILKKGRFKMVAIREGAGECLEREINWEYSKKDRYQVIGGNKDDS